MDSETHDIVALEVVDKRETDLKSPNMEPLALDRSLTGLVEKGFTVKECATDGHVQVPPILAKHGVTYQQDVW